MARNGLGLITNNAPLIPGGVLKMEVAMSKSAAGAAVPNVNQLFQSAKSEQELSPQSISALQVNDLGADIQAALGTPAGQVDASSVVLVQGLIDDSGSIRFAGNTQVVRDGQNLVKEALKATKVKDGVLMGLRFLNAGVISGFQAIDQTPELDSHNYNPEGGTPLYDETINTLKTVVLKTQEFSDAGVPVRSITYIVTDGHDESSRKSAKQVASVVKDLLKSESHIICGIGIDDSDPTSVMGGGTDFKKVFGEMGIPDEWIIDVKCPPDPGESEDDRKKRLRHMVRKAFQTVSQSAVKCSQNAASFSKTALGGFAAVPVL